MNQTHEQLMDEIIFRTGKGARYDGRIEDIRGYRRAMKAEAKRGWWARFRAFLSYSFAAQ